MGKWHRLRNTRLYSIWVTMRSRCNNPNTINYKYYGEKGIKVCEEWDSFMNFYDWATNNGYSDELTLDRLSPDGNYEPKNCRWISLPDQQRNRSNNVFITIKGVTKCLSEWCRIYGMNRWTVLYRHNRGIDWETALTTPVKKTGIEV